MLDAGQSNLGKVSFLSHKNALNIHCDVNSASEVQENYWFFLI